MSEPVYACSLDDEELAARRALAASSEGDELRSQLGILRRLLRWLPLNTVAMRRRVAKRLCDVGSFPALITGGVTLNAAAA